MDKIPSFLSSEENDHKNNLRKRFLLFLVGCIGLRTFLMLLAKYISIDLLPYLGYLFLIIAIGFFYRFVTGNRPTGPEVFGEKIWWNDLRPLHGILCLLFALYAITKHSFAWIFLAIDVSIGLVSFLTFHYLEGNFTKI